MATKLCDGAKEALIGRKIVRVEGNAVVLSSGYLLQIAEQDIESLNFAYGELEETELHQHTSEEQK